MSLVEQLRLVLPDLLPEEPVNAVSGTELIGKVRDSITGDYADCSFRQAFSTLAGDPTSPLARLEGSHGYYRRPQPQMPQLIGGATDIEHTSSEPSPTSAAGGGRQNQSEEKFRALYSRYARWENRFPLRVEHVAGQRQVAGVNKWKFPDLVVLDWDTIETSDNAIGLDRSLLEVKRGLGERPFTLSSVELKVELSLGSFREHFFQCVSNSMWAHQACLAVAMPITDSLLGAELRRLGASYGVSVQTFGLTADIISKLPIASDILSMDDEAFEQLSGGINPLMLAPGKVRPSLDWEHIRDMKAQSPDFVNLVDWVARCLRDSRSYPFESFMQLKSIEKNA